MAKNWSFNFKLAFSITQKVFSALIFLKFFEPNYKEPLEIKQIKSNQTICKHPQDSLHSRSSVFVLWTNEEQVFQLFRTSNFLRNLDWILAITCPEVPSCTQEGEPDCPLVHQFYLSINLRTLILYYGYTPFTKIMTKLV